jgi:hypothetical protein
MQMDDLVRDGNKQTWLPVGRTLTTERRIAAVAGNTITLEVPLSDSFDSQYAKPQGIEVEKIRPPARLSQVGIELLHIESPPQAISHTQPHFTALRLSGGAAQPVPGPTHRASGTASGQEHRLLSAVPLPFTRQRRTRDVRHEAPDQTQEVRRAGPGSLEGVPGL